MNATAAHDGWPAVLAGASAPYRRAGRYAWSFARGKLGGDPVFRHLLSHGLIAPRSRVLDIGCGQGLLAALLREAAAAHARGSWPADWASAPVGAQVVGIELIARDVDRARTALGASAEFICGDMRSTPFPRADTVVILDALHYIGVADQDAVLARVHEALLPGGRLLLRVGDRASSTGAHLSQAIDALVMAVRGRRYVSLHARPLDDWLDRLHDLGFADIATVPMSAGTPFANVLLTARAAHA